ncbi:DUF3304 domain-containing protein [Cronobacter dublinensis]|uniref:DUF3304 domain-containing protein n=1 Tax=Cronobacter dublinensis TaxID=413497 RepID=UPI0014121BA9|nr:DUF3304 domain-containing protein [Cronobacter dublinensis]NHV89490.1 DUF3304 domain-containing protein [Cronobacter dublinensis]
MGFYTRLEKIDAAVNRGYARWGKWIWLGLSLPVVFYAAWLLWASIWGPPTGAVTLIIHSELDRPVLEFSVNGVAGSNASAHGGGGATCCGSISGDNAEVTWTLSTTRAQYDAGLRKETRRIVMPLPKREWGEDNLHVHFLPGDKVLLGWSKDAWSPYEKRTNEIIQSKEQARK